MLAQVQRWVVVTNNYCNLHCEACCTSCHLPLGSTVFGDKRYDIPIWELDQFLRMMPANQEIRLVGGETTCMPQYMVSAMIFLIRKHGHRSSLLTNGYALPELLEVSKPDYVTLDDHGINHERVAECAESLESRGVPYEVVETLVHFDLEDAAKYNDGVRCDEWFTKPALYNRVIYPCCSMMLINGGSKHLRYSLYEAGWTIDNPWWVQQFKESELPAMADEYCLKRCYMPKIWKGKPYNITLKHNDVLRKQS